MDLGIEVRTQLPFLREQAESLMTLTLRAYAPGVVTDTEGIAVPGYTAQGDVQGKVQGPSSASRDTQTDYASIGGVQRPVVKAGLHLPVDATKPVAGSQGVGWEYEVIQVSGLANINLLGKRYLVVGGEGPKSFPTALRLDVAEVS